jgi:hypothetical protein
MSTGRSRRSSGRNQATGTGRFRFRSHLSPTSDRFRASAPLQGGGKRWKRVFGAWATRFREAVAEAVWKRSEAVLQEIKRSRSLSRGIKL